MWKYLEMYKGSTGEKVDCFISRLVEMNCGKQPDHRENAVMVRTRFLAY